MAGKKVIQGNVSGSVSTVPLDLCCKIESFFLTPRINAVINLYIATDAGDRAIVPINLSQVSGTIYVPSSGQLPIFMDKGQYLIIVSSASVDYWFSISDI